MNLKTLVFAIFLLIPALALANPLGVENSCESFHEDEARYYYPLEKNPMEQSVPELLEMYEVINWWTDLQREACDEWRENYPCEGNCKPQLGEFESELSVGFTEERPDPSSGNWHREELVLSSQETDCMFGCELRAVQLFQNAVQDAVDTYRTEHCSGENQTIKVEFAYAPPSIPYISRQSCGLPGMCRASVETLGGKIYCVTEDEDSFADWHLSLSSRCSVRCTEEKALRVAID